jgi:hypothetical protein
MKTVRTTKTRRGQNARLNASEDLGVMYRRRGKGQESRFLDCVRANPLRGQYVLNQKTGVYTFSKADMKRQLVISCAVDAL